MSSKRKRYNARFPAGRIKKIMQTDEEVGKVAHAVPVIISRATELFVESLLTKAAEVTNARNAKTLTPSHMKQCILSETRFDFLKDLVSNISDVSTEEDGLGTGVGVPPTSGGTVITKRVDGVTTNRRGRGSCSRRSSSTSLKQRKVSSPKVTAFSTVFKENSLAKQELSRPPVIQHTATAVKRPLTGSSEEDDSATDTDDPGANDNENGFSDFTSHSKPLLIDDDYDT